MSQAELNLINRRLNAAIAEIEGDVTNGLRQVGLYVENESNETVPHEYGVLINSSFSAVGVRNNHPFVRIGYTAEYAPYVHEMPASNNFTKAGTGPKFLEKAVKENTNTILRIVQSAARVD